MTIALYDVITRFAVPCFVMLSGAFLLSDDRNAEYKYFYTKSFQNIGRTTLYFTCFYFVYSLIIKGKYTAVTGVMRGVPFGHMWYLYMLIGVYLLVPIVIQFKNSITEKFFSRVAWIFLILASFSASTSTHKLYWDIGFSFCYIGYLMIGYVLRKWAGRNKSNVRGLCFIAGGILVELFIAYLNYALHLNDTIEFKGITFGLIGPLDPLMVVASVLIFTGFSLLDIKKDFGNLSSYTFLIYLFHGAVEDFGCKKVIKAYGLNGDCRIIVPVAVLMVFLISYMLAVIYKKLSR